MYEDAYSSATVTTRLGAFQDGAAQARETPV
jgi:hypothetical protein